MVNFMVMLEVGGMGMIRKLGWKERFLKDHNRATLVVSDYHRTIWIWEGSNVTSNTRKQAPKVAQKIMTSGYSLAGETLGMTCENVILMDEAIMTTSEAQDSQEMNAAYQQLLQLYQTLQVVPHGTSEHIVVPAEATSAAPAGPDPRNDNLAGIMLVSILREYPESFVCRTADGTIQVETGAGPKFNYRFENFQLQLLTNSQQIPSSVMQHFQTLTKP